MEVGGTIASGEGLSFSDSKTPPIGFVNLKSILPGILIGVLFIVIPLKGSRDHNVLTSYFFGILLRSDSACVPYQPEHRGIYIVVEG